MPEPLFSRLAELQLAEEVDVIAVSVGLKRLRALQEKLPAAGQQLHDFDQERVCMTLLRGFQETFSKKNSTKTKPRFLSNLRRVEQTSIKLARELHELESSPYFDEFVAAWASAVEIGTQRADVPTIDLDRAKEIEWYLYHQFMEQLVGLIGSFELSFGRADMESPPHAPADNRRHSLSVVLVEAWTTIELLSGKSLADSFPSSKNDGFDWCYKIYLDLMEIHRRAAQASPMQERHVYSSDLSDDEFKSWAYKKYFDPIEDITTVEATDIDFIFDVDIQTKPWSYESLKKGCAQYVREIMSGEIAGISDYIGSDVCWGETFMNSRLAFEIIKMGAGIVYREEVLSEAFSTECLDSWAVIGQEKKSV